MLAAYGLFGLPLALVGLPLTIFLAPLYAQSRSMPLGSIGLILLAARMADVIVDPTIGALSDRFATPIGRRRPWILAGTALTALGALHVFAPPPHVTPAGLLAWLLVLYTGWSMASIPYLAWGGALSTQYHRRTVITGAREFCTMLGIVAAAMLPALRPDPVAGRLDAPMRALADLAAIILPACALLLCLAVREPAAPPPRPAPGAWRLLWRNAPFRLLMAATLLGGIGTAVNGTLVVFFLQSMRLAGHPELLLLSPMAALLAIPLWVWLAARLGKHRALCAGSLWGCAWFATVPFLPQGNYALVALVTLMAGSALGAAPVLGTSMAADVIDWDTLRSRQDRSALFFSLWAMATKLTQALGILALPLIGALGFTATGPLTAQGRLALMAGYVGLPIVFWLGATALLWNFPLGRARQARLARRRARLLAASS